MNYRDQKLYKGFCDPVDGKSFVYVDGRPLESRDPVTCSGTGFGWGITGFGSLNLAFAIIHDYTDDYGYAVKYYEDFANFVICRIRQREWNMCGLYIRGRLKTFRGYNG